MSKITLDQYKACLPKWEFSHIDHLTNIHSMALSAQSELKQKPTQAYSNKKVFRNFGCEKDMLESLSKEETRKLMTYIIEQKNLLKDAQKNIKIIRKQIKEEMERLEKKAKDAIALKKPDPVMKITPKKVQTYKSGAFVVDYPAAMSLLSKLSKMIADNMPDWQENQERKMVIEFVSVE